MRAVKTIWGAIGLVLTLVVLIPAVIWVAGVAAIFRPGRGALLFNNVCYAVADAYSKSAT